MPENKCFKADNKEFSGNGTPGQQSGSASLRGNNREKPAGSKPSIADQCEKCKGSGCKGCIGTGKQSEYDMQGLCREVESILDDYSSVEGYMTFLIDDFSNNEEHIRIPKDEREAFGNRLIMLREVLDMLRDCKEKLEGWQ
jgi:hypothetical protein